MAFTNVTSAEFIRYNANAAGHSTTDCVKRALSLAFNIPYNDIAKELIAQMKQLKRDRWNVPSVYEQVIRKHGGGDKIVTYDPMYLADFADTTGKQGTWLVTTGKKTGNPDHIVCVIDGTIYDSWDSTNQYVCSWYPIEGNIERNFTDIHINDYLDEIEDTAKAVGKVLLAKYPWGEEVNQFNIVTRFLRDNNYKAHLYGKLSIRPTHYNDESSTYSFDFFIVFTPSTTDEEAHKIIKNTIKTRMYDRFYSINQQEKKKEEKASYGNNRKPEWMTPREERFWNTLSARAQSIITYVNIQNPGMYSDSYQVKIIPQHGEDEFRIWLEAGTASELKELIDDYLETGATTLDY